MRRHQPQNFADAKSPNVAPSVFQRRQFDVRCTAGSNARQGTLCIRKANFPVDA
jgi:hypothetical protein